jgi:two-component system response regulator PilR (NtrC family)
MFPIMKRILIVDDESLIRYCLSMMLGSDDREVTAVANGRAALEEINEHHYDLCLLDVHLPDMNGLDIMKIMKIASPATKIIIMTASEIAGATMQSIRESAHWFISKPFDLFQVTASADDLLSLGTPLFPAGQEASTECASFTR